MKKIIAIISLMTIIFSFASCKKDETVQPDVNTGTSQPRENFDIVEKTEIVLGSEVSSVVITTADGEKITVDSSADFYEIFDNIVHWFGDGTKYSISTEMKLQGESKYFVNLNYYETKYA